LILVKPAGPACHTGKTSCFYRMLAKVTNDENIDINNEDILELLYELITKRKQKLPEDSYTTYLFEEGLDKILKKIGEESAEVIIASKNEPKNELIYEIADFLYHLLVLLVEKEVSLDEIKDELQSRYNK
jgi:phosphoribosyl-ATP pyrophosphohydrolase/phosphoribosyl-AMP cyclohydrolase